MGWCIRESYYPVSSAVCNATIPTLPLFEMAESVCLPFCYVLHLIIHLLFIKFISAFLSRMRDWTVAVAQHSTVHLLVKVQKM
jgi:hypothetical protein